MSQRIGRIAWRRALLAATTTVAALAAVPGLAQASVTVQLSGSTLTVTGGAGADRPAFGYVPPADDVSPGYTAIVNADGIADPLPAGCVRDPGGVTPSPAVAFCSDGGSAPLLATLDLVLGGGDDEPAIDECFDTVHVDAGDGQNRLEAPDCDGGALTWTSGAGNDYLRLDGQATTSIDATLGAGGDTFRGADGPSVVRGGADRDELVGGAANDRLYGEDGDDDLVGLDGDDTLDGGAGSDRLAMAISTDYDDDPGADDYRGGADRDTLYYDAHGAGVDVSLDEQADDGSAGERDSVRGDIEAIHGSDFDDVFTGGPGDDWFIGRAGADRLAGAGGHDTLDGGEGDDSLNGGPGSDALTGDAGNDTVNGGPGADRVYGDRLLCTAKSCVSGNDTLLARDGETDAVVCGQGTDSAQVDFVDQVGGNGDVCETLDRGAAPPPLFAAVKPTSGKVAHFTTKLRGRATVAKGATIVVTCPADCTFTVSLGVSAATARRLGLGRRAVTLARASGALPGAGSKTIRLRPSTLTKRTLRKARSVPVVVKVRGRGTFVKLETKTLAATLRR